MRICLVLDLTAMEIIRILQGILICRNKSVWFLVSSAGIALGGFKMKKYLKVDWKILKMKRFNAFAKSECLIYLTLGHGALWYKDVST